MTKVSSLGRLGAPMLLRDYVAANLVIFLISSQEVMIYWFCSPCSKGRVDKIFW